MISASKINTYIKCPRNYYLSYIIKVPFEPSPEMLRGSRIHEKISNFDFSSEDVLERHMLKNANSFLQKLPPNPIMETTYEDKNNPGRFYGDLFNQRTVGIFDFHWKDPSIAGDWKTGKLNPRFTKGYEVQAYILNELYKQKYNTCLEKFYFKFLRDGAVYQAKCLHPSLERNAITDMILDALCGIETKEYHPIRGPLCKWCGVRDYCDDP